MNELILELIVLANTLLQLVLQILLHVWQHDNIRRAVSLTDPTKIVSTID